MNAPNKLPAQPENVMVLGLGLTGYSVVRYLVKQGCAVSVADSRELPPYLKAVKYEFPEVTVTTGRIPFDQLEMFDRVVASPGIDLNESGDLRDRIIGDIELFSEAAKAPIIGITGSNGKSTVTMLVNEMLLAAGMSVKTGGNIGTPALDLLAGDVPDYYVLELSSFQLESTHSLNLLSATVLNLSEDHMDRYSSLDEYRRAKARIFRRAKMAVLNRDDSLSASLAEGLESYVSFGLNPPENNDDFGLDVRNGCRVLVKGGTAIMDAEQLTLPGSQNISNVLAAMALVESAGVELEVRVVNAAANYGGLPHRCEIVKESKKITWVNDSKGTNAGATIAAIKGFANPIILIAGGKGKGADFSTLAQTIKERVTHTILFGEDARVIASAFEDDVAFTLAQSLEEAVQTAVGLAAPGSVVLFSPACASFDMFDNYEHRGNAFKQLVLEWTL